VLDIYIQSVVAYIQTCQVIFMKVVEVLAWSEGDFHVSNKQGNRRLAKLYESLDLFND
jgi:hypothetical protein